ncbi:hypothetical protein H6G52_00285 [Limnothrix sp. FACHB-881]|uniref:hypothetical protein n=1 Tax=Limnothrix sp. FACHB-881 TaxID=2692819 RepID=UPI0016830FF9|nr:hypothetical protein [Limnothrix sp. FACHB-881]MBD2633785.1 hypothetical protein [Limnothrix sp. FACHB-881]
MVLVLDPLGSRSISAQDLAQSIFGFGSRFGVWLKIWLDARYRLNLTLIEFDSVSSPILRSWLQHHPNLHPDVYPDLHESVDEPQPRLNKTIEECYTATAGLTGNNNLLPTSSVGFGNTPKNSHQRHQ